MFKRKKKLRLHASRRTKVEISSEARKQGLFKNGSVWGGGGVGGAVGGRKAILNGILFSELYQLANVSYKRKKEGRNFMY